MPFQHGLGSEDPNAGAQLLDILSSRAFQVNGEEGQREFLGTRDPQGFVKFTFDDGELPAQEQDLEILGTIGLVTQQDKLEQGREALREEEPAHRTLRERQTGKVPSLSGTRRLISSDSSTRWSFLGIRAFGIVASSLAEMS